MTVLERLEAAAKEYDWQARTPATDGHYDFGSAELRQLLLDAAQEIRMLQEDYVSIDPEIEAIVFQAGKEPEARLRRR